MQNNIIKEIDLNQKSQHDAGAPFMNLLLKIMDASELSVLINGMYKTAKDGFSFSIFQEIFDLAGIENTVYFLTFEQLVEIQPTPSIVYLNDPKCFAILDKIEQNEITLLIDTNNTLVLDKSKFGQAWDGILLPIDDGSFSKTPTVERTTRSYQLSKNNYLEIVVLPVGNHPKSTSICAGHLSASAFVNDLYFCFETIIPACKRMTFAIKSKSKTNKQEQIISEYDIPISFGRSTNILRLHFAKTNDRDGFNIIGLRGSTNQIFKVNEK